jgi:hypothetical protein
VALDKPWDEKPDGERSYLTELLTHQYTLYGFLSSIAAGSLLAIPYDFGLAALPLLGFGALTSLAALFVPSSLPFRRWVDRRHHDQRRASTRAQLVRELQSRETADHPSWEVYGRMVRRVQSLRELAQQRSSSFFETELERLDDATVDFLGLWLARISMGERLSHLVAQDLPAKLAQTDRRIETAAPGDRRALEKARADLERLLASQTRIETHQTAIETAMLAMSDALEEVYQGVMSNPASNDASNRLQQAVDRMRIEDDLGSALDEDLEGVFGTRAKRAQKVGAG